MPSSYKSRLDRAQARWAPTAFVWATVKKFLDDGGSRLAALLAYYAFLSVFPLVIGGFAVLNLVLSQRPEQVTRLVREVVPPPYQTQVIDAYQALPSGGVTLVVALLGLLLTGMGGVMALYFALNQVFAVPYRLRMGVVRRYATGLLVVLLLGAGMVAIGVGSILVGTLTDIGTLSRLGGFALVWLVGTASLHGAAGLLVRPRPRFAELGLGAVLGAFLTTLLTSVASLLVARYTASASTVYGAFATAVGVISVLFLVSNALVFSFEASVVHAWKLWPRGIDKLVLLPADERALELLVHMHERVPEQRNTTTFDPDGSHGP